MEFEVKYNVTMTDEEGEYEELRPTIACVTYASKYVPATFYDPEEGGELEFEFQLPNGDPDTFAEANCSDADRATIAEYITLGDGYHANAQFRKMHGWDD